MQEKTKKQTNKMNRKKERYRFYKDLNNEHLILLLNICIEELDFKSFGRIFQNNAEHGLGMRPCKTLF